jgi:oligoribonuclease NrnB/cAMP/cGMP phosphodiesterase (DHH superfamily)
MGWLKLYYRDNKKVMRALEGIKVLVVPGSEPAAIYLAESVYTLTSQAGRMYWFDHHERHVGFIEGLDEL